MALPSGIKTPRTWTTSLRKVAGTTTILNKSRAADIAIDTSDSSQLKFNQAGTVRTLVTTAGGQTQTSPVIVTPSGVVTALEAAFTQVAGNKVHTASFPIPAGATILDIFVTNVTVWNSGTSAVLKVGLVDDDCFFVGARLDSGVLVAGSSINFEWTGAFHGASLQPLDGGGANDVIGTTNGFLYNATAQTLTAIVTDTNVSGTNGRTRVTVLYSLPSSVIAPVVV